MADLEASASLDISDALSSIDDLASETEAKLTDSFENAVLAFVDALRILDVGNEIGQSLEDATSQVGQDLRSELSGATDEFANDLTAAGTISAGEVSDVIRQGLVDAAAGLDEALTSSGGNLGAGLEAAIDQAAEDARVQIETNLIAAADSLDPALEAAISQAADFAKTQIEEALTAAAQEFGSALGEATSAGIGDVGLQEATNQFDALGAAADDAGGSLSDSAEDLGFVEKAGRSLSGGLQVAQGETGGLTEGLSKMSGAIGPVATGFAAAGGAAVGFAAAGLTAISAQERVNQVFGETADQLDRINIGGLTGDLDELANKAGSTSSPLKQIDADLGQFVISGGLTQTAATDLAGKFNALTLRAIALKPKLGDAGEAGQRLFTALSRGRDTALIPFALGIDKAGVQVEALKLGLIDNITQALTPTQKIMAGVQLAVEKAGNSLGTDFSKGADQAAVKLKSLKATLEESIEKLGAPLVAPLLDVATELVPAAEAIGRIAAQLLTAFLPALQAVTPLLGDLADVLGVVADVLEVLGPVLVPVAAGFLAFSGASALLDPIMRGVASAGESLIPKITGLSAESEAGAAKIDKFQSRVANVGAALPGLAAGLALGISSLDQFGESAEGTAESVGGFALAGASLGGIIGPEGAAIGAVVGVLAGLTAGLIAGGESLDDYRDKFVQLGKELDSFTQKQALEAFLKKLGTSDILKLLAGDAKAASNEIEKLASSSPASAEKVVAGLKKMRDENGKPLFDAKDFKAFDAAVAKGTGELNRANSEKKKSTERNQELTASSQAAVAQLQSEAAAAKAAADEITKLGEAIGSTAPTAEQALSKAADAAQQLGSAVAGGAQTAFGEAQKLVDFLGGGNVSAAFLTQGFNDTLQKFSVFNEDLGTIIGAGNRRIAEIIAKQGPEAGGALAHELGVAIRSGQPEVAKALDEQVAQLAGLDKRLAAAVSLTEFQTALADNILAASKFQQNLQILVENGFGDLAIIIAKQGQEKGGQVVQQLVDGMVLFGPEFARSTADLAQKNETVDAKFKTFGENLPEQVILGFLASLPTQAQKLAVSSVDALGLIAEGAPVAEEGGKTLGDAATTGLGEGLAPAPGNTEKTMGDVKTKVDESKDPVSGAAKATSDATSAKFKEGIDVIPTVTKVALDAVQKLLLDAVLLAPIALVAGAAIGESFVAGIAGAIEGDDTVAAAARGVVSRAESAARDKAKAKSPSELFAELGSDLAAGVVVGIARGIPDVSAASENLVRVPRIDVGIPLTVGAGAVTGVAGASSPQVVDQRVMIDKVVLEQASPNPVKEAMSAGAQLRRGATIAGQL